MAYIVKVGDKEFQIGVERESYYENAKVKMQKSKIKISLNGKPMLVEVIEGNSPSHLSLIVENKPYDIIVEDENTIYVNGEPFYVEIKDELSLRAIAKQSLKVHAEEITITVPMPGLVIEVEVKEGDKVKTGQGLVVVEAMKMQNEIKATMDGVVKRVAVKKGMTVNAGDTLVIIE